MPASSDPRDVAVQKLNRIFGEVKGPKILQAALSSAGLSNIETADDLLKVARALEARGQIEGAAGAMLSVAAVMMGARTDR